MNFLLMLVIKIVLDLVSFEQEHQQSKIKVSGSGRGGHIPII
jgi:hypothetical protein